MTDRTIAQQACTPNEYAAWNLWANGMSERSIALHLGISRSAVQSRLENAKRKIHAAKKETAA